MKTAIKNTNICHDFTEVMEYSKSMSLDRRHISCLRGFFERMSKEVGFNADEWALMQRILLRVEKRLVRNADMYVGYFETVFEDCLEKRYF